MRKTYAGVFGWTLGTWCHYGKPVGYWQAWVVPAPTACARRSIIQACQDHTSSALQAWSVSERAQTEPLWDTQPPNVWKMSLAAEAESTAAYK